MVAGSADFGNYFKGGSLTGGGGHGWFYDSRTGSSDGGFLSGAAVAYSGSNVVATPTQDVQPRVGGMYAGVGGSIFATNGRSVQQLSDRFTTFTLNVGIGPIKFSALYARGGSTWLVALSPVGPGAGVSFTRTVTNTKTQHTGCR